MGKNKEGPELRGNLELNVMCFWDAEKRFEGATGHVGLELRGMIWAKDVKCGSSDTQMLTEAKVVNEPP